MIKKMKKRKKDAANHFHCIKISKRDKKSVKILLINYLYEEID